MPAPVITLDGKRCTYVYVDDDSTVSCIAPDFFPATPGTSATAINYPYVALNFTSAYGVRASAVGLAGTGPPGTVQVTYPNSVLSAFWSTAVLNASYWAIPSDGSTTLLPVQALVVNATSGTTNATLTPLILSVTGSGAISCSLSLGPSEVSTYSPDSAVCATAQPSYGVAFSLQLPNSAPAFIVGTSTVSTTLDVNGGSGSVVFPAVGINAPVNCTVKLYALCTQGAATASTADNVGESGKGQNTNPTVAVSMMNMYGDWRPASKEALLPPALNLPQPLPALIASFVWSFSSPLATAALTTQNDLAGLVTASAWPNTNATRQSRTMIDYCYAGIAQSSSLLAPPLTVPLSSQSPSFWVSPPQTVFAVSDGSGAVHQVNFSSLTCAAHCPPTTPSMPSVRGRWRPALSRSRLCACRR